jgi:serine/threonine protein phosphatase PrpC
MNTSMILKSLLIVALLMSGAARAADTANNTVSVVAAPGTTVARFQVGDSQCVLKDDQIQCTPVSK